ncbi:sugar ABC transporter substrate-binding protein [Coraliomargarita parva]|uniref:sugar ABC transporter substrate-binding protein n=1 Tax=Coraliomargarita parva TaxID=3014050 RepID=UPI0022B5071E|nr:substrate-binding domain-containing protein [Coraliomargarita parva]
MRLVVLSLLTLISTCTFAQNREVLGEYKIGIIGRDQEDAIYQAAHLGAQNAARALSQKYSIDVELLVLTPDKTQGDSQSGALGMLFVEDADGLIISPSDSDNIRSAVEFASEAGQSIIFFEESLKGIQPLASVVADETEAGRLAAQAILPKLPTQARVAVLTSAVDDERVQARLKGVREVLGYKRIEKIVATQPDYRSAIETIRQTIEADRNHYIQGWIFLDDWPLLGMPALPWKAGKLPCVAIQSSPSAFIYIDQGYVDALVVHPYYDWGYQSMEILVNKLYRGIDPDTTTLTTEPRVVDWRNVEDYRQNWKSWLR